jgi:hypothetical protein
MDIKNISEQIINALCYPDTDPGKPIYLADMDKKILIHHHDTFTKENALKDGVVGENMEVIYEDQRHLYDTNSEWVVFVAQKVPG